MIYKRLSDIPWYDGIVGEVVRADVYRLKQLKFIPDVIFDLGANIGVFTRYARDLFPKATIISVEPNAENFTHLMSFTHITNWIPINRAIGGNHIWHNLGAANGSGESYVSSGIGYDHMDMVQAAALRDGVEACNIETISLAGLIKKYARPSHKFMVKFDIEGGEHAIFQDAESMRLLKQADYIAGEIHLYALKGGKMYDDMVKFINDSVESFRETHEVERTHVEFYATKKC